MINNAEVLKNIKRSYQLQDTDDGATFYSNNSFKFRYFKAVLSGSVE